MITSSGEPCTSWTQPPVEDAHRRGRRDPRQRDDERAQAAADEGDEREDRGPASAPCSRNSRWLALNAVPPILTARCPSLRRRGNSSARPQKPSRISSDSRM